MTLSVPSLPLIPAPLSAQVGSGTTPITPGTAVHVESSLSSADLEPVIATFLTDVAADIGLELQAAPAGSEPPDGLIHISVSLTDEGLGELPATSGVRADGAQHADERHGVRIDDSGIAVWGPTPEAVYRGLTTVRQLLSAAKTDGDACVLTHATILDTPRFAWRGLSFDVVRTFHGVDVVRHVLDMLAVYKLNVLHFHLTDDQGWRFEVPGWPELTGTGAAGAMHDRPGGFFTDADLANLVAYARERFITIVPEFDMPGHVTAIFASYPELEPIPTPGQLRARAAGFPIGTLDRHQDRTWELVQAALSALIERFPDSARLHIGGDEAWGMDDGEFVAFVDRAIETTRGLGKEIVVWQEASRAAVGEGDVVQFWIEPNEIRRMFKDAPQESSMPPEIRQALVETFSKALEDIPVAVSKGAKILASPFTHVYLDRPYADQPAAVEQAELHERLGLRAYSPISLEQCGAWDPVEITPAVTEDSGLAGVEAAIWCETITSESDLQFLLLPRLPQVAETAWSPAGRVDWADQSVRLAAQAPSWDRRGWAWFKADSLPLA